MQDDATYVDRPTPAPITATVSNSSRAIAMPHGALFPLARGLWLVAFFVVAGMFLIGMPEQFKALTSQTEKYTEYWDAGVQPLGISRAFAGGYDLALDTITVIIFMAVGAILFWKRPNDRMAYLASLMLITWGVFVTNDVVNVLVSVNSMYLLPYHVLTALGNFCLLWFAMAIPDGRFVPKWSRWVLLAYGVFTFFNTVTGLSFLPDSVANSAGFIISVIFFISAGLMQWYRRRSKSISASQSQQIKWIIIGLLCTLAAYIFSFTAPKVFPILQGINPTHTLYALIWQTVLAVALCMIPITIAFSVFRYRLWDIDLVVNRGVVIGLLTIGLGGIFVVGVIGLQFVFQRVFGQDQAAIAVAVSAILIGSLFGTARQRVQRFVDRRVYGIAVDFRGLQAQKPKESSSEDGEGTPATTSNSYPNADSNAPNAIAERQFGQYTAFALIGRGGMGEVYHGKHQHLNRDVAIKVLPASAAEQGVLKDRFEREAQTVATLHHPSIVQLYDFGRAGDDYYMAMEFVRGQSLAAFIERDKRLTVDHSVAILRDITSALDYAHTQHVIHRDVKPSNIMLRSDQGKEQAVLMDFGIAKTTEHGSLTKIGDMVGTLNYIAPEQIMGLKEVDGRADIYSLGIVAFEMLTGVRPFGGENPGSVLFGHLQRPPPNPRELNTTIPSKLAAAILQALAKKPEDRYQTPSAFMDAIEAAVTLNTP